MLIFRIFSKERVLRVRNIIFYYTLATCGDFLTLSNGKTVNFSRTLACKICFWALGALYFPDLISHLYFAITNLRNMYYTKIMVINRIQINYLIFHKNIVRTPTVHLNGLFLEPSKILWLQNYYFTKKNLFSKSCNRTKKNA